MYVGGPVDSNHLDSILRSSLKEKLSNYKMNLLFLANKLGTILGTLLSIKVT